MRLLLVARQALVGAVVCGWFLKAHDRDWFGVDAMSDDRPTCHWCKRRV